MDRKRKENEMKAKKSKQSLDSILSVVNTKPQPRPSRTVRGSYTSSENENVKDGNNSALCSSVDHDPVGITSTSSHIASKLSTKEMEFCHNIGMNPSHYLAAKHCAVR